MWNMIVRFRALNSSTMQSVDCILWKQQYLAYFKRLSEKEFFNRVIREQSFGGTEIGSSRLISVVGKNRIVNRHAYVKIVSDYFTDHSESSDAP